MRRAVALGDAFMGAGSQTTEQFARQVGVVREATTDRAGHFPIAKRVYIAVEDDDASGRSRLTEGLTRLYGYFGLSGFDALGVGGTPKTCVAALREVVQAGAEMIVLNPLYDDRRQMERLAAEVVPAVG